eukprot:scaffold1534_cov267-Pinguiococcus_pyrenoidosus.AAC.18
MCIFTIRLDTTLARPYMRGSRRRPFFEAKSEEVRDDSLFSLSPDFKALATGRFQGTHALQEPLSMCGTERRAS